MNTEQIERELKKYKETWNTFLGCYPSDELPTFPNPAESGARALICNTDPKTKPGSHWVSFLLKEKQLNFLTLMDGRQKIGLSLNLLQITSRIVGVILIQTLWKGFMIIRVETFVFI